MEGNCGKYYYATNPNCTTELVRLMETIGKDSEDHQATCAVDVPGTDLQFEWKSSYLKSNYASIAPQLTTYLVNFKDAPIEDSLWLVLEPYHDGEEEPSDCRATIIDVFRTTIRRWAVPSFTFEHHKHKDALDYLLDVKGYEEAEVGPIWNVYYDENGMSLIRGVLRGFARKRHTFGDLRCLEEDRSMIIKTNGLKDDEVLGFKEGLGLLGCTIRENVYDLLNILRLRPEDVDALKAFTKDRVLTEEAQAALFKVVNYEDKGTASSNAVDDPVLQSSILTFDLTLKTDLSKVKSDNPLYTLVVAKAKMGKPILILYRRKPVEFRSSEQTGFTQQEMAKLLT